MIGDQISSVRRALSRYGFQIDVSNELRDHALNIIPEGFTRFAANYICEYCRTRSKKIALLITEHVDLDGRVSLNDVPLGEINEYSPNAHTRFANLLAVLPHVRLFLVVGHLPDPNKLRKVFRAIPIVNVPYVPLDPDDVPSFAGRRLELCFTGSITRHRELMMKLLDRHFRCVWTFSNDPEARRVTTANSQFNLQIPQNPSWRHISPMRVIFALGAGTSTLNLTAFPDPVFDSIAERLPPKDCVAQIALALERGASNAYERSLAAYNTMAQAHMSRSALPIALSVWSDLEWTTL